MGEKEMVTQDEFRSFEKRIIDAIGKVETNLGSKVDQLTLELKAQNKAISDQGTEIARIKDKIESHSKKLEEHDKELQANHDEILINKTEHTANINQLKWIMGVITFIGTVIGIIMKFWPNGGN